ncbi:MAG: hypothetical protein ACOYB2_10775 [Limnohabitans sp.]
MAEKQYETVTLVVEYDPAEGHERLPEKWDWDTLVDGTARVLHAWTTEMDELSSVFDVCSKCLNPIKHPDDVVWIKEDERREYGVAMGPPFGDPFHVECAPPEPPAAAELPLETAGAVEGTTDGR